MIGQMIGNYRVVRQLGQGGMGQVFEAVHEQIRRRAAIKVLNADFSRNAEVVARFMNEALAVNVVQHPSLVGVFETGQIKTGAAYIVMEYLEGETLRDKLDRETRLPEATALLISRQIASALAATHAKQIIHRDLKAENVMLVQDPEVPGGQRVKILDFGLAKVGAQHQGQAVATREGMVMGTPSYMPPEQWLSATKTDGKSDVYALGVLTFLMLSGQHPFVAGTTNALMMKIMYEEPESLRELAPHVSTTTVELIHAMLVKQGSARPSMNDVAVRLERLLASLPATSTAQAASKPEAKPPISEAKTEKELAQPEAKNPAFAAPPKANQPGGREAETRRLQALDSRLIGSASESKFQAKAGRGRTAEATLLMAPRDERTLISKKKISLLVIGIAVGLMVIISAVAFALR